MADSRPRRARDDVLQSLTAFTAVQNDLTRSFARTIGLHTTDAAAIVQVIEAEELGRPLTPARLGERIALSSGATSILLGRLEHAGYIRRTHENSDRRVVTLRSTVAINDLADAFFDPLTDRLSAVLGDFPPAVLDAVATVTERLRVAVVDYRRDHT